MLSEIPSASFRAILPTRGPGDGIGGLIAIDSPPSLKPSYCQSEASDLVPRPIAN